MPPDTEAVQTTALHPAARPRGFRTRSLRASLTVWLGALGVLPALAATIVTAMAFSHLQRHAEVRRTTAAADSAAQGVAAACRRLEQAADAAAREHALSAAVGAGEAALQRVCAAIVAQQNVAGVAVYGGRSQLLGQSGEAPAPLAVPAWRRGREDDPNAVHFIPGRGGGLWVAAHAELATDVAASGKSRGLVVVFLRLGDAFCAAQSENAGAEVFLYGTQGEVLARSSFPPPASDLAALARSEESHAELTISGHGYLVASRAVLARGRPSGVMVGAMSGRQEWRGALYRSGWLVLGMLGGVVLVALGTGAALARRIAEPMVEIANAAHGLAAGDLGRRARVDGHDEIRSLAESFNYMAGRLEEHALELRAKHEELDQHVDRVQQLNDLLRQAARTDSLTQVGTHGYIQEQLAKELELAQATQRPLSVLMIDVDHFKWLNDTYGHPAGDRALREVAGAISGALRHSDLLGRHGGDEFCVVLPNATAAEAARCAERIRSAASRIDIGDRNRAPLKITVSVGVAAFPDDGTEVSSLVAAADQALYQAKLWRNMALTSPSATGSPPPDDDLPALDGPPVQVATAMAASVDSASSATAHHSFAVAARATMVASALGLPADGRRAVRIAGLVHDLGKIGVSREVAAKGDDLPPEERRMLQCHADLGARVLRHLGVPDPIPEIVRHHHERYDGTGYPCGLEGKAIPLGARILAVAEAFVLLTWPRESGPPISAAEALSRIERESGRAFDPDIASALFRILPGTGNALSTPAVEPRPAPETVAV